MIWKYLVILAGSFLIGSLSLSILASKTFFGGDIREKGSGNAGATNMARVHGWGAGLLTLAGDAAKATVCMVAGKALAGEIGLCIGAGACMLGHCFPVLHGFKGGKGIAVGGAVGFGIDWRVGLCTVGAFLAGLHDDDREVLTAAIRLLVGDTCRRLGIPWKERSKPCWKKT